MSLFVKFSVWHNHCGIEGEVEKTEFLILCIVFGAHEIYLYKCNKTDNREKEKFDYQKGNSKNRLLPM